MTCRTLLFLFAITFSCFQTASAKEMAQQTESYALFFSHLGTEQNVFREHLLNLCVANIVQKENNLTCEEYPFFGHKRKITAIYKENHLSLITISLMRDYMAELVNDLTQTYGQPAHENMRFAFYQKQGVCIDFAKASISFSVSPNTICTDNNHLVIRQSLSKKQWLADLAQLDHIIRQHHVAPLWFNSESSYQTILKEAKQYLHQDKIESDIAFSYFERMVAHLADGHAYIANKTVRFGTLPIRFAWFGDDLVVTQIESKYEHVLGAAVTHIDDKPINDVLTLIKPYVSAVNTSGLKSSSQIALRFIGLLYAANITEQNDNATFQFTLRNGQSTTLPLYENKTGSNTELVSLNSQINNNTQLHCQTSTKRQCVQYLAKNNAVYLRYKSVTENTPGDIKNVSDDMTALIKTHNAQRLIVDIRDNWGGNSYLNSYLLNAIINNNAINQPGKLYLLTNHNTFSAAINFTGTLAMNSHAIIVGQPVGDAPIFPGEGGPQAVHLLPNSNALVSLSFSHWQTTFLYDQQLQIPVDIPVKHTVENVMNGHDDEALYRALTHKVAGKLSTYKPYPLSTKEQKEWLGRYNYSHDKALVIAAKNNHLTLTVEGEITAELYPVSQTRLRLSTGNLFIEKKGENLVLFQNSKPLKHLQPLQNNEHKPLELLLQGEFAQAKMAYQRIYKNMPDYLPVSGNNLGLLASKLSVKYDDKNLYQQIRNIAIALHGYPIKSWEGTKNEVE